MDAVDEFAGRSSGLIWFRGHSNTGHTLNSGLFRLRLPSGECYHNLELKLYRYYRSLGYLLHDGLTEWELLYSMQHHGLKTRLLDWTESFAVALYFAVRHWTGQSACIWMLDPVKLNRISLGVTEILTPGDCLEYPSSYVSDNKMGTVAVYPVKNTNRISMQHGVFTVQGNALCPLDEEFGGSLIGEGALKCLSVGPDAREDAIKFLRQNDINHFTLFPDLDGLAVYLNHIAQN